MTTQKEMSEVQRQILRDMASGHLLERINPEDNPLRPAYRLNGSLRNRAVIEGLESQGYIRATSNPELIAAFGYSQFTLTPAGAAEAQR